MEDYTFGPNRADVSRLKLIEELHDRQSISVLQRLALPSHKPRVLEIGAGAGSMALWMRDNFGPECEVIAVDQDVSLLRGLSGVAVHELDVTQTNLAPLFGPADLIHARLLATHLGANLERILIDWAAALRAGGWLIIEDIDSRYSGVLEGEAQAAVGRDSVRQKAVAASNVRIGRQLPGLLLDLGLDDVAAEGRMSFSAGSMNPTIEAQYRLMKPGYTPPANSRFVLEHSTLVSSWGRRPT